MKFQAKFENFCTRTLNIVTCSISFIIYINCTRHVCYSCISYKKSVRSYIYSSCIMFCKVFNLIFLMQVIFTFVYYNIVCTNVTIIIQFRAFQVANPSRFARLCGPQSWPLHRQFGHRLDVFCCLVHLFLPSDHTEFSEKKVCFVIVNICGIDD